MTGTKTPTNKTTKTQNNTGQAGLLLASVSPTVTGGGEAGPCHLGKSHGVGLNSATDHGETPGVLGSPSSMCAQVIRATDLTGSFRRRQRGRAQGEDSCGHTCPSQAGMLPGWWLCQARDCKTLVTLPWPVSPNLLHLVRSKSPNNAGSLGVLRSP